MISCSFCEFFFHADVSFQFPERQFIAQEYFKVKNKKDILTFYPVIFGHILILRKKIKGCLDFDFKNALK